MGEQSSQLMREKLRIADDNNREMVNFIKSLQS
jgi:hypothetical protein